MKASRFRQMKETEPRQDATSDKNKSGAPPEGASEEGGVRRYPCHFIIFSRRSSSCRCVCRRDVAGPGRVSRVSSRSSFRVLGSTRQRHGLRRQSLSEIAVGRHRYPRGFPSSALDKHVGPGHEQRAGQCPIPSSDASHRTGPLPRISNCDQHHSVLRRARLWRALSRGDPPWTA
jgi:hypothetical protein